MLNKAAENLQLIHKLHASEEGWVNVKETADCIVYERPSTEFKGNMYKAVGMIPAPFEEVFHLLYPGAEKSRRKEWDNGIDSVIIDKPGVETEVVLTKTEAFVFGLVRAREFVDLVKIVIEKNRIFTSSVSVEHPKAPLTKQYIRGFNYPNSIICAENPANPNETILTQFVHSDLGGQLPRGLIETAMLAEVAGTYLKIKAVIAKDRTSKTSEPEK